VSAALKRAELNWNRPDEQRFARLRLPKWLALAWRAKRGAGLAPSPAEEL